MEKFFNNVINDNSKKRNKLNTNFFYITTILFILVLFICFWSNTQENIYGATNNFWNIFFVALRHVDISHVAYNCIMFLMSSLILERHFGSFTYLIMICFMIPLANLICFASVSYLYPESIIGGWYGTGASCLTFFLFGFSIILVLLNYKQYILSKTAILTIITISVNVLFASVNLGEITTFESFFNAPQLSFMQALYYPTTGHFAPFIGGICIAFLIIMLIKLKPLPKEKQ